MTDLLKLYDSVEKPDGSIEIWVQKGKKGMPHLVKIWEHNRQLFCMMPRGLFDGDWVNPAIVRTIEDTTG